MVGSRPLHLLGAKDIPLSHKWSVFIAVLCGKQHLLPQFIVQPLSWEVKSPRWTLTGEALSIPLLGAVGNARWAHGMAKGRC